jgi:hypothetical protein
MALALAVEQLAQDAARRTDDYEEEQLRLGLSQVLRYRHRLE